MNDFVIKLGQAAAHSYLEKVALLPADVSRRVLQGAVEASPERLEKFVARARASKHMSRARNVAKGIEYPGTTGAAEKYDTAWQTGIAARDAKKLKLREGVK